MQDNPAHWAKVNARQIRSQVMLRHYRTSGLFPEALAEWQRVLEKLEIEFTLVDLLEELGAHDPGRLFDLKGHVQI